MSKILRRGSKGAAVRELQLLLNQAGAKPALKPDGDFGNLTDVALRAFQHRVGLVADGAYGPQSRAALKQFVTLAKSGKPEPDKTAMAGSAPVSVPHIDRSIRPPNVANLKLLATARQIDEIFIHCAATPEGRDYTVADMRGWHKARGWSDIGYHYIIYRDGRVMLGRPVGQVGAHASGHNARTIGICYVGGVSADGKTAKDTRTLAQRSSLLWLTAELIRLHGAKRVRGHNEVAAKACPSFDVRTDPLGKLAA